MKEFPVFLFITNTVVSVFLVFLITSALSGRVIAEGDGQSEWAFLPLLGSIVALFMAIYTIKIKSKQWLIATMIACWALPFMLFFIVGWLPDSSV